MKVPGDKNIRAVYWVMLVLGLAYGMSIAVLAIHLDRELAFSKQEIGWLAASFATGLIAASVPSGMLVTRVGPKPVLVLALLGYTVSLVGMTFARTLVEVAVVRAFDGVFSVAVWVAAETILLERGERREKALVMSFYALSIALGYVIGPLLARLVVHFFPTRAAFPLSAGLAAVACGLAYLRLKLDSPASIARSAENSSAGPSLPAEGTPPASALDVFIRIKTACLATFSYGAFQASVVLFLPIFLERERGVRAEDTIYVTAFFAAGMLLFSNYASRLGDRYGHLRLMTLFSFTGFLMVASFAFIPSFALMCLAVFVAGGTLASLSPLSLALQGLVVEEHELGRANALYNAFYASGMLLGPIASSAIFERYRGAAMLSALAALWGAYVLFTIVHRADDPRGRPNGARNAEC